MFSTFVGKRLDQSLLEVSFEVCLAMNDLLRFTEEGASSTKTLSPLVKRFSLRLSPVGPCCKSIFPVVVCETPITAAARKRLLTDSHQ